jgi:hypothetical protein
MNQKEYFHWVELVRHAAMYGWKYAFEAANPWVFLSPSGVRNDLSKMDPNRLFDNNYWKDAADWGWYAID